MDPSSAEVSHPDGTDQSRASGAGNIARNVPACSGTFTAQSNPRSGSCRSSYDSAGGRRIDRQPQHRDHYHHGGARHSRQQLRDAPTMKTALGVAIAAGSLITDDGANIVSARVVLTNASAGDLLTVAGGLAAAALHRRSTPALPVKSRLTLTGTSTLANYRTAIQQVRYSNSSRNPDPAARILQISVNDGLLNSYHRHGDRQRHPGERCSGCGCRYRDQQLCQQYGVRHTAIGYCWPMTRIPRGVVTITGGKQCHWADFCGLRHRHRHCDCQQHHRWQLPIHRQ